MLLGTSLKKAVDRDKAGPVWAGPEKDGVTQSLLGRYLVCKERFRLLVIKGLKPAESFHPPIDYGNMWHCCEEALAGCKESPGKHKPAVHDCWIQPLKDYCQSILRKFPLQQEAINHWFKICVSEFPIYVEHWAKHKDVKKRTPLLSEEVFDVKYQLPSGRIVRLRGKWDSVDLVEKKIWLQENKTKSQVDRAKLERQMKFDLQTMVYLIAYDYCDRGPKGLPLTPIAGVRYNVVRRSAHKTPESMVAKIKEDFADGRHEEWFLRFNVEISKADIDKFKRECLDPELENLCDDYEWWAFLKSDNLDPFGNDGSFRHRHFPNHYPRHARRPFGVYDVLAEGGSSDLDHYLETGSEKGLQRCTNLFPELTNV